MPLPIPSYNKAYLEYKTKQFLSKINKTDSCWLWTGPFYSEGYGRFTLRKSKSVTAHKASFQIFNGIEAMLAADEILHTCDNRKCVNPAHLYAGTQKQNVDDMYNRNRQFTEFLTKDEVREIINKYSTGEFTQSCIARQYKINQSEVSRIVNGKRWQQYI